VEEEKALKEPEAAMPISTEEETKRKVAEDKLRQEAEVAKPQIAEKQELWNQQEAKKLAEEKAWQEVATRKITEEDAEKLAESRVASMLSENWKKKRSDTRKRKRLENWQKKRLAKRQRKRNVYYKKKRSNGEA
jgi:hypothetical protein